MNEELYTYNREGRTTTHTRVIRKQLLVAVAEAALAAGEISEDARRYEFRGNVARSMGRPTKARLYDKLAATVRALEAYDAEAKQGRVGWAELERSEEEAKDAEPKGA